MGENKVFKVTIDGEEAYNRLTAEGGNRKDEDPHPSEDARTWGPIVPHKGNKWWGGPTPGKLAALKEKVQAKLNA